eukprot:scaffold87043_cov69-Phaeocystis_antarctica.AAC.2
MAARKPFFSCKPCFALLSLTAAAATAPNCLATAPNRGAITGAGNDAAAVTLPCISRTGVGRARAKPAGGGAGPSLEKAMPPSDGTERRRGSPCATMSEGGGGGADVSSMTTPSTIVIADTEGSRLRSGGPVRDSGEDI